MPLGKRQRRILLFLGWLIGGVLVILLSLPLWFPWVLRPLARHAGARYGPYEREGYSHFKLRSFSYTNQSVNFTAGAVEALTPTVWLWRLARGAGHRAHPYLSIHDWDLRSVPGAKASSGSVYSKTQTSAGQLEFLRRWVPVAVLSNGTAQVQGTVIRLPALTWVHGRLRAQLGIPKLGQEAVVTLSATNAPYEVGLQSDTLHLRSGIQITTNATGLALSSTNLFWNNPVRIEAEFARTSSLPVQASIKAPQFKVPASLVNIPDYSDINGSLSAQWRTGRFDLDLTATAQPLPAQTNLPPVDLDVHARGDTTQATIETATVNSPWVQLQLSRQLTVHFQGPLLREPAHVKLAANLGRQPWFPLQGSISGEAQLSPGNGKYPKADFQVTGSGIGTKKIQARELEVEGSFNWPLVTLSKAEARFADGSTVVLAGRLELKEKAIQGGQFKVAGPLGRQWLPPGYSYETVSADGQLSGSLTNLSHSGRLQVTRFTSPALRPLQLALDWEGFGETLTHVNLGVSTDRAGLSVACAVEIDPTGGEVDLKGLTLRQDTKTLLALAHPARLSVHKEQGTSTNWLAIISPFDWSGSKRRLQMRAAVGWPMWGSLTTSASNLGSTLLAGFLKRPPEPAHLRELQISAAWTNSPVEFQMRFSGADGQKIPLSATARLAGGTNGISIAALELSSQSNPVITATGFVPVTFSPSAASMFQIHSNAPLRLEAVAQPEDVLWNKFAEMTGVRLRRPHMEVAVEGTVRQPHGRAELQVAQIDLLHAKAPMPRISDLDVSLRVNRQEARLVTGKLMIAQQPVEFSGAFPLGQAFWSDPRKHARASFEKARAQLRIDHARLAAVAGLFPSLLSPQGELNANLALLPGFNLNGNVQVQHARTRPLPGLGPVRDIQVQVQFKDHLVSVAGTHAELGGATVRMAGTTELSLTNLSTHGLPPFSFSLSGTNVPFVRQPSTIIRGDLLLGIGHTNGAPPLISGLVHLQNSYFLSDLSALVPGGPAGPRQRPPYFSIDKPPVSDWRLDVQVSGDKFLKVRTTPFNGEVSANFQVQGTLKSPVAVGDVHIDSGVVQFPFGSLQVQQGFVSITKENPYQPQLSITATSKQFGYDIKMRVSGPADAPVIEFSSTPPLTSEQILLLLTTGQMPQGNFTLTPQQRAQTLAVFLARDILTKLGFGSVGESRLTIHSGQEISETGKPTYTIEFKLTKNWSLVAEYDRFGDYNAGVKWRIYSK